MIDPAGVAVHDAFALIETLAFEHVGPDAGWAQALTPLPPASTRAAAAAELLPEKDPSLDDWGEGPGAAAELDQTMRWLQEQGIQPARPREPEEG